MITTVSNPAKAAYARRAGAHHAVNYRDADAADQIRRFEPGGVDLIIEVAIDRNSTLDLLVLRPRGTISVYAFGGEPSFRSASARTWA